MMAYRGLAERLACDGPVGHAQEGTGQHDEITPSKRQSMDRKGRFAKARRGGKETGGLVGGKHRRSPDEMKLRSKRFKFVAGGELVKSLALIG